MNRTDQEVRLVLGSVSALVLVWVSVSVWVSASVWVSVLGSVRMLVLGWAAARFSPCTGE